MPNTRRRRAALLLIAILLAACATSPTGRRQLMLVSEDTGAELRATEKSRASTAQIPE